MDNVFRVFLADEIPPSLMKGDGITATDSQGRQYVDLTGGGTSHNIVGWNHPKVNEAIAEQLTKFSHADYKVWSDPNVMLLAKKLVSKAEHGLTQVYFSGNSGAEACEAAMKMSYQYHQLLGHRDKRWFISREQSYHGATSDALVLGDRPNLEFYKPMLSPFRTLISQHHYLHEAFPGESEDAYATRCAQELEVKILEVGPNQVAGFIGETIMGGLVGDVPPVGGYWQKIAEVCRRYQVHLILDEVYCGTGTTGKVYCCDWDEVKPDFIFMGKTLASGYGALSAVVTSRHVEDVIRSLEGRLQHTTTHQAHSLSVAAALAVQHIVQEESQLDHVNQAGLGLQRLLREKLGDQPFFVDLRGRGLRVSFEHSLTDQVKFSEEFTLRAKNELGILVSAKWHRISFTPALTVTEHVLLEAVDKLADLFLHVSEGYPYSKQVSRGA